MSLQHTMNIRLPRSSLLTLLESAEAITLTPTPEGAQTIVNEAAHVASTLPVLPLNPAELPRRFLDAGGNVVEARSDAHVITHFPTAGLMFDVREWKRVKSLKEAQTVAAECDLLGRKGQWIIGMDYEAQLIVDREFHEPAVDKESFPRAPSEGLIYTSRKTAWSSDRVWFVDLCYGYVPWGLVDYGGLAVPVLRVPPSQ